MVPDLLDHDPAAVLAATESLLVEQRERAVDELRLVLHWADLHSTDPGEPLGIGADHLIQVGGDGTPLAQELCWAELAIARQAGMIATQRLAADALDLRHRLPLLWLAVQDPRLPVWVARKVASMSRDLGKDLVGLVDVAVAAACDQAPNRIITIAEAKVIEADIAAHRARLAEDAAKVGVRLSQAPPGGAVDRIDGEPATRRVTLKLPTGAALDFDAAVTEIADRLFDQIGADERETITRGELQVKAVELLANPAAAAAFLAQAKLPEPKRRPAVVYVHLSELVLGGKMDGVARVEDIGPMLLDQLTEILAHRNVTLAPVIDLNQIHAVNGYEHPTLVKSRSLLRAHGDVFPHSTSVSRRLDHDHPTPYRPPDKGGPPGQTGDHNDAPLTRRHHRVKTHRGYALKQLGLGAYRWVTPHGLGRLVTPTGTRSFEPLRAPDGTVIGELYWHDQRAA